MQIKKRMLGEGKGNRLYNCKFQLFIELKGQKTTNLSNLVPKHKRDTSNCSICLLKTYYLKKSSLLIQIMSNIISCLFEFKQFFLLPLLLNASKPNPLKQIELTEWLDVTVKWNVAIKSSTDINNNDTDQVEKIEIK